MASLAMRIMEGSASVAEQQNYAQRFISAGERLQRRADEMIHPVIEGEVLANESLAFPVHTVEPHRKSLGAVEFHGRRGAGHGDRHSSKPGL